jgi:hypothetical protein
MEYAMSPRPSRRPATLVVAALKMHRLLGWHGVLGVVLLLMGAVTLYLAHRDHQRGPVVIPEASLPQAIGVAAPELPRPMRIVAPSVDRVPELLTRMQRSATEQGLGWSRADYRLHASTAAAPTRLEVRYEPTGTYLAIRKFVTALLLDNPTLTLREFTLSRPSAEAREVQAKLTIVIYLRSAPAVDGAPR